MASEWPEVSIEEVKDPSANSIAMGPFGSNIKTDNFVPSGVPVIRGVNLTAERFHDDDFVFLTEQKADELRSANAFPGDLVFTHRGTLGQVGLIPPDAKYKRYVVSQSQMKLRCDPRKADPVYVFYYFKSHQGQHALLSNTSTTGVPAISSPLSTLRAIRIPLPPLPEQRAIAHILGTLDDKIELNRRMNETLEGMARALFKAWFVDFEPVRAKAEGRDPGLPPHVADLFPPRLVESELGEAPEGWEVVTLAEFAALNPESWSRSTSPDEIEYVDLSNTKWGRIEATTKYAWKDAPSRAQRVLRPGDTIVGTVRPANGSYALIGEEGLTGSTGFAVLRPRRPEFQEFVYLAATSPANIERLAHLADGAAYPAVLPGVVAATEVAKSTYAVMEQFSKAVRPLLAKMAANTQQSHTLANLRDTLLPKLISGEIRVKDAEKLIKGIN